MFKSDQYFYNKFNFLKDQLYRAIPEEFLSSIDFYYEFKKTEFYKAAETKYFHISITELDPDTGRTAEVVIRSRFEGYLYEYSKKDALSFYKFILFIISTYCRLNNVKVKMRGVLMGLSDYGDFTFEEFEEFASDGPLSEYLKKINRHRDSVPEPINKENSSEVVEQLMPMFFTEEDEIKSFLQSIRTMTAKEITDKVNQLVREHKISAISKFSPLWKVLHDAGLYTKTKSNWNQQVK